MTRESERRKEIKFAHEIYDFHFLSLLYFGFCYFSVTFDTSQHVCRRAGMKLKSWNRKESHTFVSAIFPLLQTDNYDRILAQSIWSRCSAVHSDSEKVSCFSHLVMIIQKCTLSELLQQSFCKESEISGIHSSLSESNAKASSTVELEKLFHSPSLHILFLRFFVNYEQPLFGWCVRKSQQFPALSRWWTHFVRWINKSSFQSRHQTATTTVDDDCFVALSEHQTPSTTSSPPHSLTQPASRWRRSVTTTSQRWWWWCWL